MADIVAPVLVSVTPVIVFPLAVTSPLSVNAVLAKVAVIPVGLAGAVGRDHERSPVSASVCR